MECSVCFLQFYFVLSKGKKMKIHRRGLNCLRQCKNIYATFYIHVGHKFRVWRCKKGVYTVYICKATWEESWYEVNVESNSKQMPTHHMLFPHRMHKRQCAFGWNAWIQQICTLATYLLDGFTIAKVSIFSTSTFLFHFFFICNLKYYLFLDRYLASSMHKLQSYHMVLVILMLFQPFHGLRFCKQFSLWAIKWH